MVPDNELHQGFFKAQSYKAEAPSSKRTGAIVTYIEAPDLKNLRKRVWRLALHRQ